MTITPENLVRREVHYCVSYLVNTLAQGYGASVPGEAGDLADMIEQAFELASPIDDWEEAAREDGWATIENEHYGLSYFNPSQCIYADNPWCSGSWQELCEDLDIEPYQREVFEHWIVSDWLADKLAEKGEKVDKDFAGMTVGARTTTGQAIAADSVIVKICEEMNAA
ncbi:hypothetical protein RZ532_01040 [Nitratireductor aquimarinus]|uniref:hypothetical protein n=1 Tax=Nitratireductor aquimarinus TaxID=889300 RepID=UPI00293562B4|nr:hypothetical protein [Nitratireductor aquimarinus]MDV2964546.1 hypothetical protein [Nitratireductor aquimarinus]